ncbi:hypothetical protein HA050_08390 [Iodobacter sp. HSC-16F04]|uniref:CdiI C-terminal domain-containing protein n=1 Tax=Iodobacter violaceini TaxID=3044271 RepID=A0ABX0KNT0_9NEIS|nr:hypothetical protein [Iodobacter violacea]NHQ86135.1 hypothetical protein [Iodobacter violacea]
MTFSIRLLDESELTPTGEILGEIRIGEFLENFLVTPIHGEIAEVESSWKKELESLINGTSVIALRTDPKIAWLVYRHGETCTFQEQLLLPEFGYTSADGSIIKLPEYNNLTENGDKISEWHAPLSDVVSFIGLTHHSSGTPNGAP